MSEIGPANGTIAAHSETRRSYRESMLLTLILCGVVGATRALAADPPPASDSATQSAAVSLFSLPAFSAKPLTDVAVYSATEFRPRRRSTADGGYARSPSSIIDAPVLQGTSIWQQMTDYRSQEGVRLLTLWQTRRSSLSLQAGKRGAPSLQWSAPWVNREGTSRGLFDHLFAVPARAAGSSARTIVSRPASTAVTPKPLEPSSATNAE